MIVPLLYRLLILTGTDEINTAPVLINEPKIIEIKESHLINSWEVVSPTGKTELIVPNYDKEIIKITQTNELGIYEVYNNGKHFTSFPTRLHYNEYPQQVIDEENFKNFFQKNNLRWISLDKNFNKVFRNSTWKIFMEYFLILAIIFLLLKQS